MKLQNNFTSVEQSKRLLQLGVPAWTADMFYENEYNITPKVIPPTTRYSHYFWDDVIPCWSVGRLIEIYENLMGIPITRYYLKISLLCEILERYLQDKKQLDFSKLED